jgi:dienelactone hydrolase
LQYFYQQTQHMITKPMIFAASLVLALATSSCSNEAGKETDGIQNDSVATGRPVSLKEENLSYKADTITANGYVVYNDNQDGKRPAVLIVHEWWGQNDYVRTRAKQLAEMGYIAMAVDMFGGGRNASNPEEAQALAGPFYQNPQLARTRLDAALQQLKGLAQTDTAQVAAIGYCFGGFVVLNAAKLGADLDGVVSFHGNLGGASVNKSSLKARVLIAHGAADPFVPEAEVAAFRKAMDSVGADYTFKAYQNATHAFTNPNATETGKRFNLPIAYNPTADSASWNDMKAFLSTIFQQ